MAREIDFDKIDKAFGALAQSSAGKGALKALEQAIETVGQNSGEQLNEYELSYLASSLAQQYKKKTSSKSAVQVGSFTIKTSVDEE